jgi:hypothetical protein
MGKRPDDQPDHLERDEKRVADEIEKAIPQASSIEAEALLEAAELEELKFSTDRD